MSVYFTGFVAAILLFSLNAHANPSAIRIDDELKMQPDVQAMILEYHRIAASRPNPCGDPKYFGIRTVLVDGKKRARYYVDGKGIACIPSRMRPNETWEIKNDRWTKNLLRGYQRFIYTLGTAVEKGVCSTVDSCMINKASNILRTNTDLNAFHYADCADLPYYLRAYFSFRHGLPFSYASQMLPRPLTREDRRRVEAREARANELEEKKKRGVQLTQAEELELKSLLKSRQLRYDPRYTMNGNFVAKRAWILPQHKVSFFSWAAHFPNVISTASMRVWRNERVSYRNSKGELIEELEPDFYSAALTPKGIVPGTVVYKHDGHVGVVYRIDYEKGDIYYIDAHPDNSLTWGVIDETWTKGMAGRATWGGGFKNFRPAVVERDSWFGPKKIRMVTDREIDDLDEIYEDSYSDEQYRLFEKPSDTVRYRDRNISVEVEYLDFLRLRMSGGRYRLDPVGQFRDDVMRLCRNMQYRREAVLAATEKGFHLQEHPPRLPDNIYGAQGEWERYSTPGRDVLFKQRVMAVVDNLKKYRKLIDDRHPLLKPGLSVARFKAEALAAWHEVAGSCRISYRASNGRERSFNLIEAIRRVPYMSFDPYMCPERRFGATSPEELATCTDSPDKREWYVYQQFLRNHMAKDSTAPMGWSLEELKAINGTQVDPKLVERLDVEKAIQNL